MSKPKWEPLRDPKKPSTLNRETTPQTPSFEENFKIYLRVKPALSGQTRADSLRITSSKEVEIIPPYYSTEPDRTFQYEEVFGQSATNQQVFERTMREPIRNVLAGFNSTVFIYGMTGAGKTYTMFNGETQHEGVVGLTLDRLFEEIRKD
jgi:chromosomal replication initiation ATPase DnaA